MALTVEAIDAVITKILETGQTVSVDGMSYSQANISQLWAVRKSLASDTARSTGARPIVRSFGTGSAAS
jgi:hypothetical protein